jgi:DNA-directed RNA polymerase subunit RPC12/RpoP
MRKDDVIDTNCKNCKQCNKVGRKYICNDMTACDEEIINRLCELEDKIEIGELIEAKACVWEEWEDDALGSVWNCSKCKEDFCFMEGDVNENNYGYCPHCGAKIVALKELKGEV